MREDGYITAAEEQAAQGRALTLRRRGTTETAQADFFSEEVRRNLLAAYGEQGPLRRRPHRLTTLDPALQATADDRAARRADRLRPPPRLARPLRQDRRHEGRQPGKRSSPASSSAGRCTAPTAGGSPSSPRSRRRRPPIAGLPDNARRARPGTGTIPFAEMQWACATGPNQTMGACPGRPANVVSLGDVIVVEKLNDKTNKPGDGKPARAQHLQPAPDPQRQRRRRRDGPADRPHARDVGRLGLRHEPVQPRGPGAAPARLVVQALRLSRGDGRRHHALDARARRAVRIRSRATASRSGGPATTATRSRSASPPCAAASRSRAT